MVLETADIRHLDEVKRVDLAAEVEIGRPYREIVRLVGTVVKRNIARLAELLDCVLDEDVRVTVFRDDIPLEPKVVLVHRKKVRIGDKRL